MEKRLRDWLEGLERKREREKERKRERERERERERDLHFEGDSRRK